MKNHNIKDLCSIEYVKNDISVDELIKLRKKYKSCGYMPLGLYDKNIHHYSYEYENIDGNIFKCSDYTKISLMQYDKEILDLRKLISDDITYENRIPYFKYFSNKNSLGEIDDISMEIFTKFKVGDDFNLCDDKFKVIKVTSKQISFEVNNSIKKIINFKSLFTKHSNFLKDLEGEYIIEKININNIFHNNFKLIDVYER